MIAKIAVSAAVFAIDKPYDYLVPSSLPVQPGQRVSVPFGRGNRVSEGVVLSLEEGAGKAGIKQISALLDSEPLLDEFMLRLAAFIRERYFCTYYDAIRAMLPTGLGFIHCRRYEIAPECCTDWQARLASRPVERAVMQYLTDLGGSADQRGLDDLTGSREQTQKAVQYLQSQHMLTQQTQLQRRASDKTEQIVTLAVGRQDAQHYAAAKQKSAPLQKAVLELLCSVGSSGSKELCYFTGATTAVLRRLEKLGLVTLSTRAVLRQPKLEPVEPARKLELNAAQQAAFTGLLEQLESPDPGAALLYGVTGAGKTSVYLQLIHRCLDQGKSALVLVPEIALTPQLLRLFSAHFSQTVAVLHSGLRLTERYDTFKRIRSGEARVVLGTRLAVFAPLQNPGLFVVDEEQEHTYKSENSPRYHAREVALYRGVHQKALVVLGSATPAVETMYRAQTGVYRLYRLDQRFSGAELPSVELVDMKQELRAGNGGAISRLLQKQIRENVARGEQTILFLNRRGNSPMLVCVDCGHVPQCPNCSVRLTYHSANRRLMCHYCGYSVPLPDVCPACLGHLKQVGFGTQRVQQELQRLWPELKTLRMDTDTVSATNSHEKILGRFVREKIPVLIGTQMVSKGLDFENVTLVGVLDADQSLYIDTYRAAETTFAMLTQVVGRAGRGEKCGRAVIQTMTPEHTVLALAARQDYDGFYHTELALRRAQQYPPFGDLVLLGFSGLQQDLVLQAAAAFRRQLLEQLASLALPGLRPVVLGPAPAAVAKINQRYRYRLTLHCTNSRPLRQLLAQMLRTFSKKKEYRLVSVTADCNPYD